VRKIEIVVRALRLLPRQINQYELIHLITRLIGKVESFEESQDWPCFNFFIL